MGYIDLHQHVLWGLDDGPDTPEEMHALLRADAEDGIGIIAATPHAVPGVIPFDMDKYRERLREAQAYCTSTGLPIKLITGAEIRFTPAALPMLLDKRLPTIGGTEYVLIEFWHSIGIEEFAAAVGKLFRHGYVPIVAHLERYALCRWSAGFLQRLREQYPVLYQMNCSFLISRRIDDALLRDKLLHRGLVDLIATDAHNTQRRPPQMRRGIQAIQNRTALPASMRATLMQSEGIARELVRREGETV